MPIKNALKLIFYLLILVLLVVFGSRRGIYIFNYQLGDDKARRDIIEKCKKNKTTSKKCRNAYEAELDKTAKTSDGEMRRKKRKKRKKS